jgi:bifunctional DNA-binding transcriptional regulator/antitoxin component of YhaV-PrlF toxin-antitoxin module
VSDRSIETVRVSTKFQGIIPKKVRETLAPRPGQEFEIYVFEGTKRLNRPGSVKELGGEDELGSELADGGGHYLCGGASAPSGADHLGSALFRTFLDHPDLVPERIPFRIAGIRLPRLDRVEHRR